MTFVGNLNVEHLKMEETKNGPKASCLLGLLGTRPLLPPPFACHSPFVCSGGNCKGSGRGSYQVDVSNDVGE